MPEKIYVVTQGKYSDYHIITATTDLKLAEYARDKFQNTYSICYDPVRIEVFENAELITRPLWYVKFNSAGQVHNCYECDNSYEYNNKLNVCDYYMGGMTHIYVTADTIGDAVKIAAEKRAEFLAMENGM